MKTPVGIVLNHLKHKEMKKNAINYPEFVPDKDWKQWTVDNLPNSINYWVTDVDSLHRSRLGCVYLLEIKRKGQPVNTWQKNSLGLLVAALKKCEGSKLEHDYLPFGNLHLKKFHGIVELTFQNTWFNDGYVMWSLNGSDKKILSEYEIAWRLSFMDDCLACIGEEELCNCDSLYI